MSTDKKISQFNADTSPQPNDVVPIVDILGNETKKITFAVFEASLNINNFIGNLDISKLNTTGTPSNTTFLRGDGVWSVPAGGGGGTGDVVSVNGITPDGGGDVTLITDNISEGATNLWYTETRFNASFSGRTTTNLSEGTNLYYTAARFNTAFAGKTTDNLTEGTTNKYLSPTAFSTLFALKTTDDLAQGVTNLYNQTHTGDVTGATALTIGSNKVTLAMMSQVATATVFYRKTAGTGNVETQTLATLKTDLGLTGTNTGDQTIILTGDVTGTGTGSFVTAIAAGVVVNADINAAAAIDYSKLALTSSIVSGDISGAINVAHGGTGQTSLTAYAILAGGTTSTGNLQQVSGLGTSGQVLTSNGAGALPTWQASLITSVTAGNSSLTISPTTGAVVASVNQAFNFTFSGSNSFTGAVSFTALPTSSATPSGSTDLTTKTYVDSLFLGIASPAKTACAVATTANVTLSGEQTIDGILTSTSRILVKNQSAPAQNGIYVTAAGAWTRATDYDSTAEVMQGTYTFVIGGSTQGGTIWVMNSPTPTTLGTDPVTFAQIGTTTIYTASLGVKLISNDFRADLSATGAITLTGNSLQVAVDNSSIEISSNALRVKAGGITNAMLTGLIDQSHLGTGSGGAGTKFLADDQTYKTLSGVPGVGDVFSSETSVIDGRLVAFDSSSGKLIKTTDMLWTSLAGTTLLTTSNEFDIRGSSFHFHTTGITAGYIFEANSNFSGTGTGFTFYSGLGQGSTGGAVLIISGGNATKGGGYNFTGGDGPNGGDFIINPGLGSSTPANGHFILSDQFSGANVIFNTDLLTSDRIISFPDQTGTILLDTDLIDLTTQITGILPAINGGTGFGTYVVGDILQANTTSTLSRLSAVATGNVLISGGVSTVSTWGKVGLATHVSGTLQAANFGALTGEVTNSAGSYATTIGLNVVTNAKLAQMATMTIKGNTTGGTANAVDLTVTQVTAMLNVMVGDSGAGGTKGLVPAPAAGDAAANKFLKANGTWAVPAGGGGGTPGGSTTQLQYNNAGAFGGVSGATSNGSNLTVTDANFFIADNVTPTKLAQFEASSISAAVTRVYTLPDANGTLALTTAINNTGTAPAWSATGQLSIPNASATATGLITTGTQTIAGSKNFIGGIISTIAAGSSPMVYEATGIGFTGTLRRVVKQSGVQTTNATQTTLLSATAANGAGTRSSHVRCTISATGSSGFASYTIDFGVKTVSGVATILGTPSVIGYEDAGAAAWDVTADVSGALYRIRVTGAAATTINWIISAEELYYA